MRKVIRLIFLAAVLAAAAAMATAVKAAPKDWSYVAVTAGTVATFPKEYALPFGYATAATVHVKATCNCGVQTITVKLQGSMDGTNYFDESFMQSGGTVASSMTITGSATLDQTVLIGRQDTATIFHPGLFYPTYRTYMTSSGGTPDLSAVTIEFYAPGRTRN